MINIYINEKLFKIKNDLDLKSLYIFIYGKIDINIIGAYVNKKIEDMNFIVNNDSKINFINYSDNSALNIIRHSCAHLLAHAIKQIYNNVQISIGPVVENGFYYDFFLKKKIKPEDFDNIEKTMKNIAKNNLCIEKKVINKLKAVDIFKDEKYKLDLINKIKDTDDITCYKQGHFVDLCKGPHLLNTMYLKYFKLLKISGVYWKGNNKNEMLQRIYGTAWNSSENLNKHICFIKKISEKSHKKIGKELSLFHFQKNVPGNVFWHPNGWIIYKCILNYIRKILEKNDYNEVNTPVILNSDLFDKSGHSEKFKDNIFKYNNKNVISVLKPMNCPCHMQIFKSKTRSYKVLPFRMFEFGLCFRNELSGSLYGLMRMKSFVQDDVHILLESKQLKCEIIKFIKLIKDVYNRFNIKNWKVVLSKRPKNRIGDDKTWEKAEGILELVLNKLNIEYSISNDGAFYGPKLEFILHDYLNRQWQCGTIQIDFFSGKNLNIKYTSDKGKILNPIIFHGAILGSVERFIGILLEITSGFLPFWVTPIQINIIGINEENINYANNIYNILNKKFRVNLNLRNENLGSKIKKYIKKKIPYIVIIGDKEVKSNTISVREISGKVYNQIKVDEFIKNVVKIDK